MNYSELRREVVLLLNRSDLTANIPAYVERAESMLFREINAREVETSVTGPATHTIVLPANFHQISRLTITQYGYTETLVYSVDNDSSTTSGSAKSFTLESNQIKIFPPPSGGTYTLYYLPDLSPLSDVVSTNWILANAPDAYLYTAALEGARSIADQEKIAVFSSASQLAIQSAKSFAERKGQPVRGRMQIKAKNVF